MVATRSLALAAALAAALALPCFRGAEGVKACGECSGTTTCIVEDMGTRLTAGSAQLALRLCNYNAAAAPQLAFRLKTALACDTRGALVPKLKALKPSGVCPTTGECAVVAELESAIDWAIAMRSGADLNAVLATFTSGGSTELVTVAQSAEINGAAMAASTGTLAPVSVCAGAVDVKALRLSQVDGCSTADICRGKATDSACVTPIKQGLPIMGVTCDKESCAGKLALSGALACDAALGESTALIVAVKVGTSALSNYAGVGTLSNPSPAITDVSDLEAGSSTFTISTDSYCPPSAVQVNVSKSGGGAVAASVTSVNSTNGSVVVTLSAPLETALDGTKLAITLTQCSVASKSFESLVGDDDSGDAGVDSSTNSSRPSGGKTNSTSGTDSTQESNVDTGLSGGMYVGIAVGVVALLGFIFECWFHKRRQTPAQQRTNSDAPVASGYAHSGSL